MKEKYRILLESKSADEETPRVNDFDSRVCTVNIQAFESRNWRRQMNKRICVSRIPSSGRRTGSGKKRY